MRRATKKLLPSLAITVSLLGSLALAPRAEAGATSCGSPRQFTLSTAIGNPSCFDLDEGGLPGAIAGYTTLAVFGPADLAPLLLGGSVSNSMNGGTLTLTRANAFAPVVATINAPGFTNFVLGVGAFIDSLPHDFGGNLLSPDWVQFGLPNGNVSATYPLLNPIATQFALYGQVVPLPAAGWLLLSALAGFGVLARRRRGTLDAAALS